MRLRRTHRLGWENAATLILVSLVSLLGLGQSLAGKERPARAAQTPSEATLRITLRIYNYANVPSSLLDRAESEAATIFVKSGIKVEWLNCPLTEAQMARYPACQGDLGATDFVLNLLPESMAERAKLRDTTFGFAQLSSDGGSYVASVFWDRITQAVHGRDVSTYQLLGHATAHEIGHLLLGSMSHARTGLMSASWGPPELEVMARAYLPFTAQQGQQMRVETLARMRQEEPGARRIELAERTR